MNIMSKIVGMGSSVPKKRLTNFDLEKMVDTSDEWIFTRTGVKERRIADPGTTVAELAAPAAIDALKMAGVDSKELDLIICATSTPDMMFPSTACAIQALIGAAECPAFDLLAACSGFVYSLSVADQFIRSGSSKTVLLVASEIYSKMINWEDRGTCVLFGDGSAAIVLQANNNSEGVLGSEIHSDGKFGSFIKAGGMPKRHNFSSEPQVEADYFVVMKGSHTFKVAVKKMTDVSLSLLEKLTISPAEIDLIIPHQANERIMKAVAKSLNVDEGKVFNNIAGYGNTSAASIPLAMTEAYMANRINKGDLVLTVAFGGGLTWGANLIRF
ncbi:MAG TPA: beta-ketoacyl-ACP synthase III [Nitrospinota bacterium]|nr:beta-ketoacyl-ACP synthase III [Nitrospinota bacterium]|tara:strand:+ start:93112 stop:94095 length:984 start_codon:yes stop_codon:yes gene_type:complete